MLIAALIIVVLPILGLTLLSLTAPNPSDLGVHDGRLADCPSSPNCVCSQASRDSQRIEPIPFDTSVDEITHRLKRAIGELPRTNIVADQPNYLRAECRSVFFRFVDDLEFLIDTESQLIHVRSASRAGHSDLGVNRRRVEQIRASLRISP